MRKMKIQPDPRNARIHDDRNTQAIETSLAKWGAGRSVVVDRTGKVIAGNATLAAAEKLGIEQRVIRSDGSKLVVIVRDDLDEGDPRRDALAIADNRTTDLSVWESDVLNEVLADLAQADAGILDDLAFTERELQTIQHDRTGVGASELSQSVQLKPAMEYVVICCEPGNLEEWEQLKTMLNLGVVRRGGYKPGSVFEQVSTERVLMFQDFRERLANADRDPE